MFKLYLRAAFMGLTRYKFFSAINIMGLAVSLTAFILMTLYLEEERRQHGNTSNLYIFSTIDAFILVLACINFISLSTARAAVRAKEVAVKKVTGAARRQLTGQFFLESFVATVLALGIALVLTAMILPLFNYFMERQLQLQLFSPDHVALLLILLIMLSALSGAWPALILSGFKPAATLTGRIYIPVLDIHVRKSLVVFQFTVSIILLICSIVIWQQLHVTQRYQLNAPPIAAGARDITQQPTEYATILQQWQVFNVFAVLAIFIACLGLFGLALFSIRQRTKEIGIRKVLGAGAPRIACMLSGEFARYVAIAALIAIPFAWTAIQQWLQDIAHPTIVRWWVFVAAALLVMVIALLSVSIQIIKASLANPVHSLRAE